jgi:cytochrome c oxidase cbb3-type subunit III
MSREKENRHDEIQGEIIHEYDGIEEADNRLPRWWLLTFYGSIAFAIVYWFSYHELQVGPSTSESYAEAISARAAQGGNIDEPTLLTLSQDPATVARGQSTFEANCVACHGDRAQGVIGPNLTDGTWLHGGQATDIYRTVREGVQTRGMPAWGPVLGERPVQSLVAYILTLRDQNQTGGRPPEGEPFDPGA